MANPEVGEVSGSKKSKKKKKKPISKQISQIVEEITGSNMNESDLEKVY